jgi:hypothetical protein
MKELVDTAAEGLKIALLGCDGKTPLEGVRRRWLSTSAFGCLDCDITEGASEPERERGRMLLIMELFVLERG